MNIAQIEKNLIALVDNISKEAFVYDLLLAYGVPKATVSLLKKGKRNLSKRDDQIILKKKLFFQEVENQDLHNTIDTLKSDEATHRHDPRFVVVTDYKTLLAIDTKTDDRLDINITDITKHPFFFGPWAKIEKSSHINEKEADVKASIKMAKIYDELLKNNEFETKEDLHGLNIFLSRLLFCFFAEDTGIFKENSFTNAISSHTQDDGSDLQGYLNNLFAVLNTQNRKDYPEYMHIFPYVNGGLFGESYNAPVFSRKSRQMIIECGELDWQDINPDIFGSMFQAVVHVDQRSNMGMHYTSVPNIMKVIEPLFLNELQEELEKFSDNPQKLDALLKRLTKLRIFDPACGSGNFLIIAYKQIRTLEMQILKRLDELSYTAIHNREQLDFLPKTQLDFAATYKPTFFSNIQLSQFYGIELDDFAHEVAILSLWLAEHQMNVAFKEIFGQANPTLPLKEGGKIVCGNATRIPWEDVCPKDKGAEIYILGNPPYLGGKSQSKEQKNDMAAAFHMTKKFGELDYISCWFMKASEYIENTAHKFAFVSTNSICQGAQVHQLWPHILNLGLEILFAHKPFKWSNNAKLNAGVTCSIIGVSSETSNNNKFIYDGDNQQVVPNITPYLHRSNSSTVVKQSLKPISSLPKILTGNSPYDGGNLILSQSEKDEMIESFPQSNIFLRRLVGSQDYLNDKKRWCLWINDENQHKAIQIPPIFDRIQATRAFRQKGGQVAKGLTSHAHKFRYTHQAKNSLILIPRVSSERRPYIPFGFLDKTYIVSDSAQAIYDPEPWVFGIVTSAIHMAWVRITAGRLKTDYRYSSALCYNTFPMPDLTGKQKQSITTHVYNVLDEREKHSDKTMAQLYDPDKMPDGLRGAHHDLDIAVERCYRSKPFISDEERLEYLFKLYEQMTTKEKMGDLI
jgi:type I restriction-modification system DNA methylase subunit